MIVFTVTCLVWAGCGGLDEKKNKSSDLVETMNVKILKYTNSGYQELSSPQFPSLPCPRVQIDEFKISNIRKKPNQDWPYVCDITVKGSVFSKVAGAANHEIQTLDFYVNDGDEAFRAIPVEKSSFTMIEGYPSYDGGFGYTLEEVPVTEGNNTFRIRGKSGVYGNHGFSFWRAVFEFPYEGDDAEELGIESSVAEPSVTDGPEFLSGSIAGEATFYSISASDSSIKSVSLTMATGQKLDLPFARRTNHFIATKTDTQQTLFTIKPTTALANRPISDSRLQKQIRSAVNSSKYGEREKFMYGFSMGFFYEGADIVFDSDTVVSGVRLSDDFSGLLIPASIDGSDAAILLPISPGNVGDDVWDFPNLIWYFVSLFRSGDPKADEMVLALLVEDLKDVGLENVSVADWTGNFLCTSAELLEELIKETATESPEIQGYHLGRAFGDTIRFNIDPNHKNIIDDGLKSEFLESLKSLPYFNPRSRGSIAVDKQQGLIDGLKRFMRIN